MIKRAIEWWRGVFDMLDVIEFQSEVIDMQARRIRELEQERRELFELL